MVVTLSGITISVSPLRSIALLPIISRPSGNVMLFKLLLPESALLPITLRLSGNVMLFKLRFDPSAALPITSRPSGKVMLFKPVL